MTTVKIWEIKKDIVEVFTTQGRLLLFKNLKIQQEIRFNRNEVSSLGEIMLSHVQSLNDHDIKDRSNLPSVLELQRLID